MKVFITLLLAVVLFSCSSDRAMKIRIAKKIQNNSDVVALQPLYPDYQISTFNLYRDLETNNFINKPGTAGYEYPQLAIADVTSFYDTPGNSDGPIFKILRRRNLLICRGDILSFSLADSSTEKADSLLLYFKAKLEGGADLHDLRQASTQERQTVCADSIWFTSKQMGEKFMNVLYDHDIGDIYTYHHEEQSSYGKYMVIRKTSKETLVSETNVLCIQRDK